MNTHSAPMQVQQVIRPPQPGSAMSLKVSDCSSWQRGCVAARIEITMATYLSSALADGLFSHPAMYASDHTCPDNHGCSHQAVAGYLRAELDCTGLHRTAQDAALNTSDNTLTAACIVTPQGPDVVVRMHIAAMLIHHSCTGHTDGASCQCPSQCMLSSMLHDIHVSRRPTRGQPAGGTSVVCSGARWYPLSVILHYCDAARLASASQV
jgi:hypothetical protein